LWPGYTRQLDFRAFSNADVGFSGWLGEKSLTSQWRDAFLSLQQLFGARCAAISFVLKTVRRISG
jgi:hypothetical protein